MATDHFHQMPVSEERPPVPTSMQKTNVVEPYGSRIAPGAVRPNSPIQDSGWFNVADFLKLLQADLDELAENIERLEEKVRPVTMPSVPSEVERVRESFSPQSQVSTLLAQYHDRLNNLNWRLNDLTARLDL